MKKKTEPTERHKTIRREIIQLMMENAVTPYDISGELGISEREAAYHLEHALVSARRKFKIEVKPASCKSCGFVFKDRKKVKRPSKCPSCKKGQIESARYGIKGN